MMHRILELYSGIGGMHCAWNDSKLPGEIITAVDINTVANEVYTYNFPKTNLITRNIQALTLSELKGYNVNTILMSPPCQPFTRNGKFLDHNDPRTNSFLYLIGILSELDTVEYILMENVKGFENSTVRNFFIEKLEEIKFDYQEFLLCPSSVGIPNKRLRYYCIARRTDALWNFKRKGELITQLPQEFGKPYALDDILETVVPETFLVKDKFLRKGNVFDVCHKESSRTCCFTKAYTHYVDGTGSVFTEAGPEAIENCFKMANMHEYGSEEYVKCLQTLKLRYFTPKEVLALMAFPKNYAFPDNITMKQCYRLLGNSVNVKVISELLKILFD
ncbi:tRNA (cytosine(38)-C(5))-methyltransferase [Plodia interpunctella]|uniref:tRNA (cytosine(38)-C(5))-methyltransferase n=1 Tax=Plodia interpunctella TaxID=58824 RepID=UPI0023675113|nr:tRNA (cytosine(38)-C(5))-methyltransferase [Plodia interpunctella]